MSNGLKLFIEKVYKDAKLPIRTTPEAAGLDVFVYGIMQIYYFVENNGTIQESIIKVDPKLYSKFDNYILKPKMRILIDTGIRATVGKGYEIQVRSRSGLALKNGLVVANSPGTIDSDYRGIIGVILINNSNIDYTINIGDKIAQLVVQKVELLDIEVVNKLSEVDSRGENGFGHSGV
jgi:dUTP pyrophosphatase